MTLRPASTFLSSDSAIIRGTGESFGARRRKTSAGGVLGSITNFSFGPTFTSSPTMMSFSSGTPRMRTSFPLASWKAARFTVWSSRGGGALAFSLGACASSDAPKAAARSVPAARYPTLRKLIMMFLLSLGGGPRSALQWTVGLASAWEMERSKSRGCSLQSTAHPEKGGDDDEQPDGKRRRPGCVRRFRSGREAPVAVAREHESRPGLRGSAVAQALSLGGDRKSTRLNSSHSQISYAV